MDADGGKSHNILPGDAQQDALCDRCDLLFSDDLGHSCMIRGMQIRKH